MKIAKPTGKDEVSKNSGTICFAISFYRILVLFLTIYFKIQNLDLFDVICIVLSCASPNAGRKRP